MKTLRIFSIAVLFLAITDICFSQQVKTETLKVSGECGMCKKKIEKAAKDAGATYAVWSINTKILTIRYNSLSTNSVKIQQKIADVGYDTPGFKATDEAYNKLEQCCQYDREESSSNEKDNLKKNCCQKTSDGKSTTCCNSCEEDCCQNEGDKKSATCCNENDKNCCQKKSMH